MAKHSQVNSLQNDILKCLYLQKGQSCAELSKWLQTSIPSVTKGLSELVKEEFVIVNGYAPSTGGRKPMSYSLNGEKGFIVAVAMDQLFTTMVIVDLADRIVFAPETIELDLYHSQNVLSGLSKVVRIYIERSGIDKEKIIGVGFGMPGFINVQEGINYTFFDQNMNVSHRSFLEKEIDLPVYLDNDSSLIALAEWKFGLAKDRRNAMVINIGWGTGLGMILNGGLFRGEIGYAGEFSHIPLSDNNILCECGKRGCLETETSLLIIAQKAVNEIKEGEKAGIKLKDVKYMSQVIIEAANKGDQYCIELLSQVGYKLGKGIAILIHIMNPGLIVLSGRGAKAEKILMAPIQQALNQYCIPRLVENTEILFSRLGEDSGLRGAAALVMEHAKWYQGKNETVKSMM